MVSARHLIVAVAAFALSGCIVINPPDEHLSEPVSPSELCTHYSTTLCIAAGCTGETFDLDMCRRIVDFNTCFVTFEVLAMDPRSGWDPVEGGRQLAQGRHLAETCDPDFARWIEDPVTGFSSAFVGTVGNGADCSATMPEDFTMGVFDLPRFEQCDSQHTCTPDTTDVTGPWTCRPRSLRGELCNGAIQCAEGLACAIDNTCGDPLPVGTACEIDSACASFVCQGNVGARRCEPSEVLFAELATFVTGG